MAFFMQHLCTFKLASRLQLDSKRVPIWLHMYETESDTELGFLLGVGSEIHNMRGRPSKAGKESKDLLLREHSSRWAGGRDLRGTKGPAEGGRHAPAHQDTAERVKYLKTLDNVCCDVTESSSCPVTTITAQSCPF